MLRMDQVHVIRHKVLVDGHSVRRVAREMKVSRNTIRHYLESEAVVGERRTSRRPRPKQEALAAALPELLEQSKQWTDRKQRLTAERLHELLCAKGIIVGYTMVKEAYREWRRQRQEVFVPLVYRPGDLGEVDFFEVVVDVAGQRQKAWMFVLRLMCSGRDFAWLYPRQDQVCFLDGHVRAFAHFGGVSTRLLYDNLKPAVTRVLVGAERQLSARFQALATHYVFEPCFARPRTGHDKGGVESRGRAIRHQHLVPIPSGQSLDEMSVALLRQLDERAARQMQPSGKTVLDAFAEDKARMLALPGVAFQPAAVRLAQASRRSLVKVEGATYSVPCEWAGLQVTAYVGVSDVEIVGPAGGRARHKRQRFGGRSVDYRHYLPELARKPGATRQVADELVPLLGPPFVQAWALLVEQLGEREGARVLSRLLGGVVDLGLDVVAERVRVALLEGRPLQLALLPTVAPPPVLARDELPSSLQAIEVVSGHARDYDTLLGGAL
jgi:transposase